MNALMRVFLALILFGTVFCLAGDGEKFVIAKFDKPEDLARIDWNKDNVDLSIGPRLVTDFDKVLKFTVKQGQYPGMAMYPNKIPKDWSKYEALSFQIWSASDIELAIRIDDEKSTNYQTRYNGGKTIQKGRTLVQINTKDIAKVLNLTRITAVTIFMANPPKGMSLYFSNLMLGPLQSTKVDFVPYAERYDLIPSLNVVTPHFEFGRNLAGGPIPVFMLSSVTFGREVEEMMQRMDLQVSLLSWDREWGANTWGFGDFYGQRGTGSDFSLMQKYLDSSMQGPEKFGAMVMYTPVGWNRFSPSARQAILKRVKENGEGLVMVMPFPGEKTEKGQKWPADLQEVCALIDSESDFMRDGGDMRRSLSGNIHGKTWRKTKDHPITQGVPFEALPFEFMDVERYHAAPDAEVLVQLESGEPVLAVKQLGKGRVVTIAARAMSLTPEMHTPRDYNRKIPYRFWEAWYTLETRAIHWAAGREFKRDGTPIELKAEGEHADPAFSVKQWKDAAGKVTDWEIAFAPPAVQGKKIDLKAPFSVKPGDKISVTFNAPDEARDSEWSAVLLENSNGGWRTIEKSALSPAANMSVEFSSARLRQYIAVVKIEARKAGAVLAHGAAEVVVTPDPVWDDYEVHSWLEAGLHFLNDFEMQRMRECGLTCNTIGPGDVETCKQLFRHGMRVQCVGLTQGLHAHDLDAQARAFNDTKDKKNLIRHPSYADKEFVAKEQAQVRKYAQDSLPFAPLSMIMSDETALTSYTRDFDYDFHPSNVSDFREKLKAKFGTTEAMNAALSINVKSFDEVQPPTAEEARASGHWGLFNEWRMHNDDMWTGAFTMYGNAMKEVYPQTRLSVSGSQESAVFNGIDWAKLTPTFGAISGYGGRFQELQRLNFHPGGLRVTPWGGYGRSGRAVDYQLWTSLTTGGSGMGLFWWLSLRNPDLGFCKSGNDYKRVIAEMRSGIGKQYMQSKRQFSPVAILWSPASQRMAWAQGKMDEFKKVEEEVMHELTAAEYDPYFMSQSALAGGELLRRQAKILVLPMSLSLGRGTKTGGLAEVSAIEKFIAAGGTVASVGEPGYDEFLEPAPLPDSVKSKMLNWADIKKDLSGALTKVLAPAVTIRDLDGGRVKGTTATVHTLPGNTGAAMLTLLRPPVGMRDEVGADGVIHSVPDQHGGKEIETIVVDAPALASQKIYDMRAGKLLQPSNGKLTLPMQAGDGYPLAILSYVVDGIKATASIHDRALSVNWQIESAAKELAPHVVHVEVIDSAGKNSPEFSANITSSESGKGSVQFPLAEEDGGRKFTVRVHDVLSGMASTVTP